MGPHMRGTNFDQAKHESLSTSDPDSGSSRPETVSFDPIWNGRRENKMFIVYVQMEKMITVKPYVQMEKMIEVSKT